jgi:hypothetical protein
LLGGRVQICFFDRYSTKISGVGRDKKPRQKSPSGKKIDGNKGQVPEKSEVNGTIEIKKKKIIEKKQTTRKQNPVISENETRWRRSLRCPCLGIILVRWSAVKFMDCGRCRRSSPIGLVDKAVDHRCSQLGDWSVPRLFAAGPEFGSQS